MLLKSLPVIQDQVELDFNSGADINWGFPGGSVVKNPPANEGDIGYVSSIPGWGRSP